MKHQPKTDTSFCLQALKGSQHHSRISKRFYPSQAQMMGERNEKPHPLIKMNLPELV